MGKMEETRRHIISAKGVLALSLAAIPAVYFSASLTSDPAWDWETSGVGRSAWALLILVFLSAIVSSACLPKTPGLKVVVALGTGLAVVALNAACMILCTVLFGSPIR